MNKKALVIGAAGFVGPYLVRQLQSEGLQVTATKIPSESLELIGAAVADLNILDETAIEALLAREQPDLLFHLAAQSSVALSWKKPGLTVDINIKGTLNLLDAVRACEKKPRILLVGSGEEYGPVRPDDIPVSESVLPRPANLYAVTKNAQNQIGRIYADGYHLEICSTRSFNHIGPNQAPAFVVADFSKQIAEIEKGLRPPVMKVGNLTARRDFTDVRDVVRAYGLLAEKGKAGETYNVGSGKDISIEEILLELIALSGRQIRVEVDPEKLRPLDVPVIRADISKLRHATGWSPAIPLGQTLRETLDYWRARV